MRTIFPSILLAAAAAPAIIAAPVAAVPAKPHVAHGADVLNTKLTARTAAVEARLVAARRSGRVTPAEARVRLDHDCTYPECRR